MPLLQSRLGWVALGHAVLIALFLGLLNVPESNVMMLGLSGIVLLLMLVWTAIVESRVVRWHDGHGAVSILRGVASVPALILALLVFAGCWWLGGVLNAWHTAHFGEVDAWLISRAGTTDAAWLHRAIDAIVFAVRWVLGVSLAVALFATSVRDGAGSMVRFAWLKRGLSLLLLGMVAVVAVAGWQLVPRAIDWRPDWLPPNATQVAFAALKGLVLYLLINGGWLAILAVASRRTPSAVKRGPDAAAGTAGPVDAPPEHSDQQLPASGLPHPSVDR